MIENITLSPGITETSQIMEKETYVRSKHLSRETELLIFLSRVNPEASALEKAQVLISTLNWDSFTSLSIKHGTSALIYRNLLKLKDIPQVVVDKFRNIYNNSLRSNILMVSELDRLIEGLNRAGIEVISLKGATASEKLFGDIGLYPSGDIDILIKVEDVGKVKEFLKSEGYSLNDTGFDEYREFFIKELYHISLSSGRYTIEPHWNLFFRYFETPPEFWWEESFTVSSGDREYRFLSPEKNILYTSFRLFSKGFVHLRFLVLIAEIIRHYADEIDWNKLFEYARKYRFENVLRVTLKLSRELLGAPGPEKYFVMKGMRVRVLYQRALKMVLQEEDVHPLNKVLFAFLKDDVTGAFKVLFRRLFPSMGEIISRYKLSTGSVKAKVYYILNPVMLMMRKHQKQ